MSIAFNQIPGNLRVPFMRFEVNAGSSPYQSNQRLVIMGQKLASGVAPADTPRLISALEDVQFGYGSQLAGMYKIARANAPFQEIWCIPLADATGATKATSTITVSNTLVPVAAAGSIVVYVGGIRVTLPIDPTLSAALIATELAAAINACPAMQVVATAVTNVVTLTATNAGTLGNGLGVLTRMYQDDGPLSDQILTLTAMTGGAGDPSITNAITNMGEQLWDWIVMPYCTTALLNQMQTWLNGRWGPMSQTYGHLISAMDGTLGTVQAFLTLRNNMHETIMPMLNNPQGSHMLAAAVGAQCAQHLQDAPELSRPLQTIALTGILPPKALGDRFSVLQRQTLYFTGGSGYTVDKDQTVRLDRVLTTYQTNAYGQPDMSWLDINTIAQITYGIRYIWDYLTETYPRCALVDSNPNNLQDFVTVDILRQAYIHAYTGLVADGVFENADTFAELLVLERNANDPNRVDAYVPTDAVNQLRILANNVTSYLQYPAAY